MADYPKIKPNFKTPFEDFSGAEKVKLSTKGLLEVPTTDRSSMQNVRSQFRDKEADDISNESEVLAKSFGIYLEYNRAKTGREKDWVYMLRITVPGGGPINREQWAIMDDVAEKFTSSDSYHEKPLTSLRLTTRQNIQLHWIKKRDVIDAVRDIAKSEFYTINGCGDNVRNVMACPLSTYSDIYDANKWAQKAGKYFRLPTSKFIEIFAIDPKYLREAEARTSEERFQYGPNLLNRKFKLAFSALQHDQHNHGHIPDNCVELRTNDIGIAPFLTDSNDIKFQVYAGGGQGQKNGYPTLSALAEPFGIFAESDLMRGLDGIVKVHQEWGDRENRHWARLKYLVNKKGIEWLRSKVRDASGVDFEMPNPSFDYGARDLHHGWIKQPSNGLWTYGAFIENGRIIDGPSGQLKKMVRFLMDSYPIELSVTPNQDILFSNIPEDNKERFEADMKRFGYGFRNGKAHTRLRFLSGACVGRDSCRLTYTDSEKLEPVLIDELEVRWGDMAESIGVTGCERQCFRPATKTIGWVGTGLNMYQLKLGGTEDGRNQGEPLIDQDTQEMYLRNVLKKDVATITDVLFEYYVADRSPEETRPGGMGYFFRRVGSKSIISYLKANPRTSQSLAKTMKNPLAP